MDVLKFGGTSVGSSAAIKQTCEIVANKARTGRNPFVVVSAVSGVTDKLIAAFNGDEAIFDKIKSVHDKILSELELSPDLLDSDFALLRKFLCENKGSPKDKALVSSFGERLSIKILSSLLKKQGFSSKPFVASEIGLLTTSVFDGAEPLPASYENLRKNLGGLGDCIPVITGFIGVSEEGEVTTLGRGGSDFSAAIVGAALGASVIEIWTDVDGILSADPRIIPEAKPILEVSFQEAAELAFFGAKVLHPKTILPAVEKNIPVKVLNTFNPIHPGTTIVSKSSPSEKVVKAITCKKHVSLFNIYSTRMLRAPGFMAKIFEVFKKYGVSVDVVATSEVSVSFTTDSPFDSEQIRGELEKVASVSYKPNHAVVCIVGEGLKNNCSLISAALGLTCDDNNRFKMISQGASEINLTFVVEEEYADAIVKKLHKNLIE